MASLDFAVDVYRRVLDGIKKESTGILPPVVMDRLANEAQELWLKDKLREIEKDQKRIDDIRTIRIFPTPVINATGSTVYPLPDGTTVVDAITGNILPKYHRFLRAAFKITYVNNECSLTGISDWIYNTFVMRSDQFNWRMTSPHRKPNDGKIGYDERGDLLEIYTGTDSTAYQVQLDYIRPPRMFSYANNINFEFPQEQKEEIVDRCIQTYLERVADPRWKSWIQEEYMKMQAK